MSSAADFQDRSWLSETDEDRALALGLNAVAGGMTSYPAFVASGYSELRIRALSWMLRSAYSPYFAWADWRDCGTSSIEELCERDSPEVIARESKEVAATCIKQAFAASDRVASDVASLMLDDHVKDASCGDLRRLASLLLLGDNPLESADCWTGGKQKSPSVDQPEAPPTTPALAGPQARQALRNRLASSMRVFARARASLLGLASGMQTHFVLTPPEAIHIALALSHYRVGRCTYLDSLVAEQEARRELERIVRREDLSPATSSVMSALRILSRLMKDLEASPSTPIPNVTVGSVSDAVIGSLARKVTSPPGASTVSDLAKLVDGLFGRSQERSSHDATALLVPTQLVFSYLDTCRAQLTPRPITCGAAELYVRTRALLVVGDPDAAREWLSQGIAAARSVRRQLRIVETSPGLGALGKLELEWFEFWQDYYSPLLGVGSQSLPGEAAYHDSLRQLRQDTRSGCADACSSRHGEST